MSDLKPCPFCGSEAELREDSDCVTMEGSQPWWVNCGHCSASVEGFYTAEDAAEEWNTREPAVPVSEWRPIESHDGTMWIILKGAGMDQYEAYKYKGYLPEWAIWWKPVEEVSDD